MRGSQPVRTGWKSWSPLESISPDPVLTVGVTAPTSTTIGRSFKQADQCVEERSRDFGCSARVILGSRRVIGLESGGNRTRLIGGGSTPVPPQSSHSTPNDSPAEVRNNLSDLRLSKRCCVRGTRHPGGFFFGF